MDSFSSSYSSSPEQQVSVEELILIEQSLTQEERRARYRCGSNFVTVDTLPTWQESIKNIEEKSDPLPGIVSNPEINKKMILMRG